MRSPSTPGIDSAIPGELKHAANRADRLTLQQRHGETCIRLRTIAPCLPNAVECGLSMKKHQGRRWNTRGSDGLPFPSAMGHRGLPEDHSEGAGD